ncbi:hypothetical protein R6Q59_021006 [Mikania micrantha]
MPYNSTDEFLKLLDDLVLDYSISRQNLASFMDYITPIYRTDLENSYSAPMVWIGMYIALASLVCVLAMMADLLHGLCRVKLWFPCKYFRINAAFLTVISVAMKLPVDLTGSMPGDVDQAAKLGSMAFMCIMMANLLPCLATMDNNELLSNIIAMCILVITLVVNVCIQIRTGVVSYNEDTRIHEYVLPEYDVESLGIVKHRNVILAIIYVILLLVLLMIHVCSSLAVLKSKKIIESKYEQGQERASKDIQHPEDETLTFEKLQKHVTNHFIMAGSGSPQFITTCFPTTSASGVICFLITSLHTVTLCLTITDISNKNYNSDYSWSMPVILVTQFIGVVIGTIAPVFRCFATLSFKVSSSIISNHLKVFEVESYWTSKLYDWRRASMKLPFSSYSLKVVIETSKKLILSFCIELQDGVVVVCKIIALIPFVFMICFFYCYRCLKWLLKAVFSSLGEKADQNLERNKHVRPYVLHLQDEMELAERSLEALSDSVNRLIKKGEESQPKNLIELIQKKSTSCFHGVRNFDLMDHHHVPSLLSTVQYQDCWSLPVVTLTTIAISLRTNEGESLLKSVREGLEYVKLVEESLNVTDGYVRIRNEAEILWKEVEIDHKWLGHKLQDYSSQGRTQIVEWFRDTSQNIVFKEGIKDSTRRRNNDNDDSTHRSICANSMYRITKSIFLTYNANTDDEVRRKELFDNLSSMIADIVDACLTNLPQVITKKCHTSEIEKREANVKDAAQLLGKTTQLIERLGDGGVPGIRPSDLPFIDKWRAFLGNS